MIPGVQEELKKSDGATLAAAHTASFNSQWIDCLNRSLCAVGVSYGAGGSPVGELKLQGSNALPVAGTNVPADTDAADIAGTNYAVGGGSPYIRSVSDLGFRWVRLVFTYTSGTLTITKASSTVKVQ